MASHLGLVNNSHVYPGYTNRFQIDHFQRVKIIYKVFVLMCIRSSKT